MEKKTLFFVFAALLVGFLVGFFGGMEYKAYQVRKAFDQAFKQEVQPAIQKQTVLEQAKNEEMQISEKKVGDEVILSALKFHINKTEEKQSINSGYGGPKTAKSGAKFIVIDLSVTNTTNSEFTFYPDDGFRLVDGQKREFTTYPDTIGNIANYLNVRKLSPSITEVGIIVYEIPDDASNYSLVTSKVGTKDLYKVVLK